MVIDDADGLHPGVDDGGANELESTPLQFFRDGHGERGLRWKRSTRTRHRSPFRERPTQCGEVFNVFDTIQLGLPDSNISNRTAGAIVRLAGDPRVMQFAVRLTF
jgi:hypothetical protein